MPEPTLESMLAKVAEKIPSLAGEATRALKGRGNSFKATAVDVLSDDRASHVLTAKERALVAATASSLPRGTGAMLRVRMSTEDFDSLRGLAREAGFESMSEFVRFKVFGTETASKPSTLDAEKVAEKIESEVSQIGERPRIPSVMRIVRQALALSPR